MADERVSLDDMEIELPPAMEQLVTQLKTDRKTLLKDKAFQDPSQLRAFIAQYLYPRVVAMMEMLGGGLHDTYGLAVSNANQLRRMHSWTVNELQRVGSDVEEEDPLPGVSSEALEEFQQAFYALGVKFQEKLPDDEEMQNVWNTTARALEALVSEMLGHRSYDDDDDRDDDRDDDDEPAPKRKPKSKLKRKSEPEEAEAAKPEPKVEAKPKVEPEEPKGSPVPEEAP